jgi:phosphoribosylglycinamide formyltransferase-1
MKKIVILISGRGSNMAALIAASRAGQLGAAEIAAVLANRSDAEGLKIAADAGIATAVVEHRAYPDRVAFDAALAQAIEVHAPDLVVLAGFMRILTPAFVERFSGRLLNIHPSLLPAFPGVHTHAQALAAGVRVHGCTVHFVTPELDHGPIVIQSAVPVFDSDDESTLAERVLAREHLIYAQAVRWFVEDRLVIEGMRVRLIGGAQTDGSLRAPSWCDMADIKAGDTVQLLGLPDWLIHDLPVEEQEEMKSFVGGITKITEIDTYGYFWVSFPGHCFCVLREFIKRSPDSQAGQA